MLAALIRLWRRWPFAVYLMIGAFAAAVLLSIVPFSAEVKPLGKLLLTLFLWLFLSVCVAAIVWMIELFAVVARWIGWRREPLATLPPRHFGAAPELSPARQAQVRKAVRILTEAGIFQSGPDPALLNASAAECDEPIKPTTIFAALIEADYYHPGFVPSSCMANLVLHETQVEQPEDYLVEQIADLARLSRGALSIADVSVEQSWRADKVTVDTLVTMTVNGEPVTLAYPGDDKYLSTVIHHDLATRLRALSNCRRFAWLWDDGGPWISCLAEGAVEQLNDAFKLGPKSLYQWTWIDAESPHAAGTT